jgi:transcription-repair coupling factor (superfamily II helicase)
MQANLNNVKVLSGVPQSAECYAITKILQANATNQDIIYIARDDIAANIAKHCLEFFAPDIELVVLPAWDCLPYDRVSPSRDITARRMDALTKIMLPGKRIIITSIAAALQYLPKKNVFEGLVRIIKKGERINLDEMLSFLTKLGYHRVDTVREHGEIAVRGGILDIFGPGNELALRIDLFGDTIEQIKLFDPLTQRSQQSISKTTIKPVSEILLSASVISRFRSKYRDQFGLKATNKDMLYKRISEGQNYGGMEHWLPLFYNGLSTIFDYLPDAAIYLTHEAEAGRKARLEQVNEYYATRLELIDKDEGTVYYPLPSDQLYLADSAWQESLTLRDVTTFTPFVEPDSEDSNISRHGFEFAHKPAEEEGAFQFVSEWIKAKQDKTVIICCSSHGASDRLKKIFKEHDFKALPDKNCWQDIEKSTDALQFIILPLSLGFETDLFIFLTEEEILGTKMTRPVKRRKAEEFIQELSSLTLGDYIVHREHGIGQYHGLETVTANGVPHDCLRLVYAGGDKLFLPVESIDMLSRYGSETTGASLDKLGGVAWQSRKAKVKDRIKEIAAELIKIAAERELRQGTVLATPTESYDEFVARFPYAETEDQLKAIEEVFYDLSSGKPMDRLICGDVGFGKTEIALRAAFMAAFSGVQIAVVVPTTLLALQHFHNFTARFKGFPIRIAQLSRFVSAKDKKAVKEELAAGKIDIIIGTHALLAKDIKIPNLGLLIVDEEQHFGVSQKEKLKALKSDVHVLTLTATPIPRTLQMSLSGVKDLSIIATPPIDRLAIRTFVLPYDPVVVREAILRERYRGGQVFYVCPRLKDIPRLEEKIRKIVPDITMQVAHGQLNSTELEQIITDFQNRKFDLLLSTNIVESGIDIPSVNTMIVHRSDMFGLAQLYQLRGRIGRGKTRAYAYLTLDTNKALTETAQKRLEVLQTLDHLGAGFTLASHDLDIRGAGNMLGEAQSGHIREVGVELYQAMLQDAITGLKAGSQIEEEWSPTINLGLPILIPESYVPDLNVRLNLYRRASSLKTRPEIDAFAAELIDRFGPIPDEANNLFEVIAHKQLCYKIGIEKVEAGPKGVVLSFYKNSFKEPAKLIDYVIKQSGTAKLRPDHKLVFIRSWSTDTEKSQGLKQILNELNKLI